MFNIKWQKDKRLVYEDAVQLDKDIVFMSDADLVTAFINTVIRFGTRQSSEVAGVEYRLTLSERYKGTYYSGQAVDYYELVFNIRDPNNINAIDSIGLSYDGRKVTALDEYKSATLAYRQLMSYISLAGFKDNGLDSHVIIPDQPRGVTVTNGSVVRDATESFYKKVTCPKLNIVFASHFFTESFTIFGKNIITNVDPETIKLINNGQEWVRIKSLESHWVEEHLNAKMRLSKLRQDDMIAHLNDVFALHNRHTSASISIDMIPSAPIQNFATYKAFCDTVNIRVEYRDYEIENYLRHIKKYSPNN